MIRTLEYAAGFGFDRCLLCRRATACKRWLRAQVFIASRQGLPMIPAIAETVAIAKYLLMIE